MKKVFIFIAAVCLMLVNGTTVLAGNTKRSEPKTFEVTCRDVKTGVASDLKYNTAVTTEAKNNGLSALTTPAYKGGLEEGNAPKIFNFTHNRVPTNTDIFPFRAVCYVVAYYDSNMDGKLDDSDICVMGSGFLSGPTAVATCAHLLYSQEYGWCKKVEVYPTKNADDAPYEASAVKVYVSSDWVYHFDPNYDWGMLEIDFDYGKYLGWFGRHWRNWPLDNESVNVTGYPADKGTHQWRAPGTIFWADPFLLEYSCDIVCGVSGAPVYDKDNVVVGINTYKTDDYSGGIRMSEELYCFLDHFD